MNKPNGTRTNRGQSGFRGPDAMDLALLAGFQLTGSKVELVKKQPAKPPQLQPIPSRHRRSSTSDGLVERERERLPELPSLMSFHRSHSVAAVLDLEQPRPLDSSRRPPYPLNAPLPLRRSPGFEEHAPHAPHAPHAFHAFNGHHSIGHLEDLTASVHLTERSYALRGVESLPALAVSTPIALPPKAMSMSDPGTQSASTALTPRLEESATPRGGVAFTIGGDETVKVPKRRKKKDVPIVSDDDPVAKEVVAYLTTETCHADSEDFVAYSKTTVKKFGLQTILDVIVHSVTNETLLEPVRQLFAVLATVTKNGKSCTELAKKGGTRFVLSVMRKYDDGKVLLYALKTLMNLSKKEKKFSLFARLDGGIAAVIASLKRYDQEVDFLCEALKFLAALSQRNSNNATTMLKSKAVGEVMDIMRLHPGDLQLIEVSIGLLGNLSRLESNVKEFLRTSSGDSVRLMLELTDKYRDNVPLLCRCLVVLKNLGVNEACRTTIREHLKLFQDLIKLHDADPPVLTALCGVIWRISAHSKRSPIPKSGITFNMGGPASAADNAAPSAVLVHETAETTEGAELADEIGAADGDGGDYGEDDLIEEADADDNDEDVDDEDGDNGGDIDDGDEMAEALPEELLEVEPVNDPRVSTPQLDTSELRRLLPELFLHEDDLRAAPHPAYTSQSMSEPQAQVDEAPFDSESDEPVDPNGDPLPDSLLQPAVPPPQFTLEGCNQVFATPKTFALPPVRHLRYVPPQPEPLHCSDIARLTIDMMMHDLDLVASAPKNRVVFDSLEPDKVLWQPTDLRFEASFESGNCRKAIWLADNEYDIVTNTDVNASGHTQWFYFAVSNMRPGCTYKFNIINFEKPTSEFNRGMRPLFYSEIEASQNAVGWVRCGERICYYRNQYPRKTASKSSNYYTLTFELTFPHAGDTCYLTTCYPYTASQLKEELQHFDADVRLKDRYLRGVLCRTSTGNVCDVLTITNFATCARLSNGFVERLLHQAASGVRPPAMASDPLAAREQQPQGLSHASSATSISSLDTVATSVVPAVTLPLPLVDRAASLTPSPRSMMSPRGAADGGKPATTPLTVVGTGVATAAAATGQQQHPAVPVVASASVPAVRDSPRMGINKKYVVLTSRVHPGESQSSWMMKGIIDFLVSDAPTARLLRDHIVFKVVPMLNPEGVILGNHRCSLSGHDLNRTWLEPDQFMHPTIYYAKNLIMTCNLLASDAVLMFVDLHGHFRKKNVFMFGCNNDSDPALRNRERVLPFLLSQADPNFSFNDCDFKITRAKRTCGRVVVGKDLHVLNSFTMEATFAGMDIGPNKGCHLDIAMLEDIGRHLCETLVDLIDPEFKKFTQTHEAICKVIPIKEPAKKPVKRKAAKKPAKKKAAV
eukprot:TRINITY_DN11208_c0_g9_i1.p1 TRINITY_DN11208_c0_g9~~TRINITY_DN11208_c0_g9_i1.p1  ORF type:complete len:1382 (-),score=570.41 TRINITY_DN11208_c0_g9_i1:691-4836(-)